LVRCAREEGLIFFFTSCESRRGGVRNQNRWLRTDARRERRGVGAALFLRRASEESPLAASSALVSHRRLWRGPRPSANTGCGSDRSNAGVVPSLHSPDQSLGPSSRAPLKSISEAVGAILPQSSAASLTRAASRGITLNLHAFRFRLRRVTRAGEGRQTEHAFSDVNLLRKVARPLEVVGVIVCASFFPASHFPRERRRGRLETSLVGTLAFLCAAEEVCPPCTSGVGSFFHRRRRRRRLAREKEKPTDGDVWAGPETRQSASASAHTRAHSRPTPRYTTHISPPLSLRRQKAKCWKSRQGCEGGKG